MVEHFCQVRWSELHRFKTSCGITDQQTDRQTDRQTIKVGWLEFNGTFNTITTWYASPCLWNQLPLALRKPHSGTSSSVSYSPIPSPITSSFSNSPLCTSITPSLFHSRLKTYHFHKSYPIPRSFTSSSRTASTDFGPDRFLLSYSVFDFILSLFFSFLGRAQD